MLPSDRLFRAACRAPLPPCGRKRCHPAGRHGRAEKILGISAAFFERRRPRLVWTSGCNEKNAADSSVFEVTAGAFFAAFLEAPPSFLRRTAFGLVYRLKSIARAGLFRPLAQILRRTAFGVVSQLYSVVRASLFRPLAQILQGPHLAPFLSCTPSPERVFYSGL